MSLTAGTRRWGGKSSQLMDKYGEGLARTRGLQTLRRKEEGKVPRRGTGGGKGVHETGEKGARCD